MIDTHTHLYFPDYGDDIHYIMDACKEAGIRHFILPNVNLESIAKVKDFHSRYPGITSMAIGLHPSDVKEEWESVLSEMESELDKGDFIAIGEIGMDLYWDKTYIEEQKKAFHKQLQWAEERKFPVIIHSRDALEETLEVLKEVNPKVPLVFHSFTGNSENVRKIREVCDPFFGINGVVTYKNAPYLREALEEIGLERIVLETDAPYLSPVPHRGKRNDSSRLIYIRDTIADTLGKQKEEVEKVTDLNASRIFNL